jgi:signal transduction histidine kinase
MYRVDASPQIGGNAPRLLTEQSAQALLELPATMSFAWNPRMPLRNGAAVEPCRRLANLLETSSFVTVPYRQREGAPGRLYLTARKRRFSETDADFLREATGRIAAALDQVLLLEELTANAAQLERSRISRDIHDTALQPYIGLKLGLEALYRSLDPGSQVAMQMKELLVMSGFAVEDLRGYVARLRDGENGLPAQKLLPALREHAGRYRTVYGIEVEMRGSCAIQLSDRIAAEAYQIVCEALSNVHRHTNAKRAFVELRCQGDSLAIEVGNERNPGTRTRVFTPRSIAERSATLGGEAVVHLDNDGEDVVRVTIPL